MLDLNKVYNMDCLQGMKQFPDKYFDLAITDPPYGNSAIGQKYKRSDNSRFGGNFDKYKIKRVGGSWASKYKKKIIDWDIAPNKEYFDELFRVSKNQIIFGGNYFGLPSTRCFIVWVKTNIPENFTMSMCEYAWCSMNDNAKVFYCSSEFCSTGKRFHPTQKPKKLYDWIFNKYAKPGYKILDTHLGSGTSRLAAYDAELDFIGFEIDEEYFEKSVNMFNEYTLQTDLFHLNATEF